MKMMIEAELPFEECARCLSFDPVIFGREPQFYKDDMKIVPNVKRELTCKGYRFCKYLKENVLGGK